MLLSLAIKCQSVKEKYATVHKEVIILNIFYLCAIINKYLSKLTTFIFRLKISLVNRFSKVFLSVGIILCFSLFLTGEKSILCRVVNQL